MKPLLYLGIDGVLTAKYGDPPLLQWRPSTFSFLYWARQEFNCRWLTMWPAGLLERLPALMKSPIFKLSVCEFGRHKAEGIERDLIRLKGYAVPWWWLDADLDPLDRGWLGQHQHQDHHLRVDGEGESGLDLAAQELCRRAEIPLPPYLRCKAADENLTVLDAIYAALQAQDQGETPDWAAIQERIERLARRMNHTLPQPARQTSPAVQATA